MYISLNWIKDYVDLDGIDLKKLINQFTLSCAEVEGVEVKGENVQGVITAKITSVENHPNSKKLHLLKLDTGSEILDIVCGAPNVREGMIVPLAVIGSVVSGITIGKATLGGCDSYGMCCSAKELGFSEDNSGLFEFEDVPYGTWILRELKTLPQYVLDETSYEVTIGTHEEIIEITIENKFVTGTLEITKSDLSTGKLLPNVGFRIRNEKGEIVEEGYTDAHGVAKFTLRYGKYTYQEFDALDGYILDEKEYAFEITEDGQIIKAEMKNELIPKGPQTGDNSNTGFWIGLLAIALGGIVSTGIIYIRKKKEDDEA